MTSDVAAVLFEVVGEPELRPCGWRNRRAGVGDGAERASWRSGGGAAQGGLFAVDGFSEFGEGGFGPVVGEFVVFDLAEVVGGGVGEEAVGEVGADAEVACVHRRFQHRFGGRAGVLVAVEEFGRAGQVLGHPPVDASPGEGIAQQPVTTLGEDFGRRQGVGVERVWDGHGAAGEQFPDPAVRILCSHGHDRELAGVVGPERAQHEDRSTLRANQQVVDRRRDRLTCRPVAQVVLGLVQPHHRARPHAVQVLQRGPCAGRVEGVPQPQPLIGERLHRLPARPRLSRRRAAHQEHDPAAANRGILHRLGQQPVMLATHVPGQRAHCGGISA
ncbi:hypothetical protein OG949_34685 [Streptomyces scopuliridis]|uniref:hypothetical protein n=1 Tax=Streptomyces scopuliridis TaxID=452529 RepID=UPI002DDC7215|nr:hypothetical protein [Streptomyces scopuliridis]WSB37475.1 hypothetical protein OG949_34685 [Streptomyces scopuliridis]